MTQGNQTHPLDLIVGDLAQAIEWTLSAFLEDRTLSASERAAHTALKLAASNLLAFRKRDVAADSYRRNGDTIHTQRLFRAAGNTLIDLDAERTARRSNVIAFPTPDTRDAG